MMPEEDKIFGAFTECPLVHLKGIPTYEYMMNLNIYLNLCLSAVDCTLGCGKLVYLMLTAQAVVFKTHYGTAFRVHTNPVIHPVIPDPTCNILLCYSIYLREAAKS